MEIRRYADSLDLTRAAAEIIQEDCEHVLANSPGYYTLGLSGGRTPRLMLEELAGLAMPWARVHIFQVDERVAPARSDERNFTHLSDCLLKHVDIPSANVHQMPVESGDLARGCSHYEDELRRITRDRAFDMLQLGLGNDGHTASLAPGNPILDVADRGIWYVEEFNGLPRMSMTYPLINSANRILWLAVGRAKVEMCRRLMASDRSIPAGRVAQENALLLVDSEIGAGL